MRTRPASLLTVTVLALSLSLVGQNAWLVQAENTETEQKAVTETAPATIAETTITTEPTITTSTAQPTEATENTQATTLPGHVETQASATENLPMVQVAKTQESLKDYSERKFQAVRFTLTNTAAEHIELLQAEVPQALNEQMLVQQKAKAAEGKKRMFNVLAGTATAVPWMGGLAGGAGYNTMRAIAWGGHAVSSANNIIQQMPDGSQAITGQYVQRVSNVVISPKQSFTFTAVVPKGTDPTVKLVVKNLVTNKITDLQQ